MSILSLSYTLAKYIGKELYLDEDKTDILRYGFEVIIGESIKIIVLFLLAYLLRITSYVLVVFFTVGIYRFFSGGYHSETYGRCFIDSLILFLGMGKITQMLYIYIRTSISSLFLCVVAVFVWSFWIAFKWAPAETANKPLAPNEKIRQKKLSISWIIFWFTITSWLLYRYPIQRISDIVLGMLIAIIFQSISVSPTGFVIMKLIDTLADQITTEFFSKRRENHV